MHEDFPAGSVRASHLTKRIFPTPQKAVRDNVNNAKHYIVKL